MPWLWSIGDGQWEALEGPLPPRRPVRGGREDPRDGRRPVGRGRGGEDPRDGRRPVGRGAGAKIHAMVDGRSGADAEASPGAWALSKAWVRLPDPRRGGPGSGQTRGRRRGRVLLRLRLLRQARRRRARLRVLQAMEGIGHPLRTRSPSSAAGLPIRIILTLPAEQTRPSAPLCDPPAVGRRLRHLARGCATWPAIAPLGRLSAPLGPRLRHLGDLAHHLAHDCATWARVGPGPPGVSGA